MPISPRHILIIGLRNYLGTRFVETLLKQDPNANVYVLIRQDRKKQGMRLLERINQNLTEYHGEKFYQPIKTFTGDPVAFDLGLSGKDYVTVLDQITEIFHFGLASVTNASKKGLINHRTSVHNLLDTALEMQQLRRVNYLSSAFVSGDREGVIMEDELEMGQRPRNELERCAIESEKLITAVKESIPMTIYRPSLIVGDSRTGEMDRSSTAFYLLSTILALPPKIPVVVPYQGSRPLNLIPVDWATQVINYLSQYEGAIGKTYHITDPNPLSIRKLLYLASNINERPLTVTRIPMRVTRRVLDLPVLSRFVRAQRRSMDQFHQPGYYNNAQLILDLENQYPCPPLFLYLDKLIEYVHG